MNCGSVDSLNVSTRCGLRPNAFQIRPDRRVGQPDSAAIDVRDQCVASAGWRSSVATTTSSTCSSVIVGGRTGARLVDQPVQPVVARTGAATCPPSAATHRNSAATSLLVAPCRAAQHDPAPQRQRLRGLRPPRPPLQRLALLVGQHHRRHRPAPSPPTKSTITQRISGAGHLLTAAPVSGRFGCSASLCSAEVAAFRADRHAELAHPVGTTATAPVAFCT